MIFYARADDILSHPAQLYYILRFRRPACFAPDTHCSRAFRAREKGPEKEGRGERLSSPNLTRQSLENLQGSYEFPIATGFRCRHTVGRKKNGIIAEVQSLIAIHRVIDRAPFEVVKLNGVRAYGSNIILSCVIYLIVQRRLNIQQQRDSHTRENERERESLSGKFPRGRLKFAGKIVAAVNGHARTWAIITRKQRKLWPRAYNRHVANYVPIGRRDRSTLISPRGV